MSAASELAQRALREKPGIKRYDSTDAVTARAPQGVQGARAKKLLAARALGSPERLRRFDSADHYARAAAAPPPAPAPAPSGKWLPWCAVAAGLVARHGCSLHPYSGEATPPRFGDYEAHRHWMEVTIHKPLADWYSHDVGYWGLDYPPAMAYLEYALGRLSHIVDPASVALGASRGYETAGHRAWMRATVLALDGAVFCSAVAALSGRLYGAGRDRAAAILAALLSPALVLVDHGHFQYNCVPLGLALWSAVMVDARRPLAAAALFCLALNAKQTALYFAPAVFCELLGRALAGGGAFAAAGEARGPRAAFTRVLALGGVVVGCFGLCWLPLVFAGAAGDALRRCFPVERGVFEDKVANFWYAAQVVLRVRDRAAPGALVAAAAALTFVAAFGPAGWRCYRVAAGRAIPSLRGLLWSLHAGALAFFLFSYHVHEKGIIVAAAPLAALHGDAPEYAAGFSLLAAFSMLPLLRFEGLAVAYGALCALYAATLPRSRRPRARVAGLAAFALVHALPALAPPPARYPDLYPALTALAAGPLFGLAWLYASLMAATCDDKAKAG